MRIDIDTYKEILDTLTRNKGRTILTGFGVFWGIFMLVALMGSGNGLQDKLASNFEGFATNSAMVWAQNTTKPYHGYRKGRSWNMSTRDVERLKENVSELNIVTPITFSGTVSLVFGDKKTQGSVKGVEADYTKVEEPSMSFGRFLNTMDEVQRRKVCVIGKRIYSSLFPTGGDPCGQLIRVDSTYYEVVGVNVSSGNMNIGGRADETVYVPMTLMQQVYNLGEDVHLIAMTGKPGVKMSAVSQHIREVIARAHDIDPTDEQGVMVFNTEVLFGVMDSLFSGVNILVWLVGIGTLLAGAIGVSNIMMVTVRERTTEIGIRRAIGATPRNILGQIIAESILLTGVAGMSGILLAVIVLQMLQLANTSNGIVTAQFQISFWTAIGAVALLSVLGILAGLAPAFRAMSIKPVDAMRDE